MVAQLSHGVATKAEQLWGRARGARLSACPALVRHQVHVERVG
jgi:hypothetical protein